MACVHLQELYRLCQEHQLRFATPDLVKIVCRECDSTDVCPSNLVEENKDSREAESNDAQETSV